MGDETRADEQVACSRIGTCIKAQPSDRKGPVATPRAEKPRYSPSFRELYQSERVRPVVSPDDFVDELQTMAMARSFEPILTEKLRYGKLRGEAMKRWIKDYYFFVRLEPQGAAANVARCPRRGVYLDVAAGVARKSGFHEVGARPLDLYVRFARAFGLSREDLEAHLACPETMQATFTRLNHQFSTFDEGFAATYLACEHALMQVARDERAFLSQRGLPEWMKRAYDLSDDAVAYWRAYETTRGFGLEEPWEVLRYLASDGTSQHTLRTAFRDCLDIYQAMRVAWNQMAAGTYGTTDFQWPTARPVTLLDPEAPLLPFEELTEELATFSVALPRTRESTFAYILSGKASRRALREFLTDFLYMDATRAIAGQYSRIFDEHAYPAMAQAFATESGYFLTRCHMEIWADLLESELGITREELVQYVPGVETRASRFVTSWFCLHGGVEEALAGFHLGAPPQAKQKLADGGMSLGLGGAQGERIETIAAKIARVFEEHYGVNGELARHFFVLHEEIEPFEQGEGWEYVERTLVTRRQQEIFRRAFVTKVLAERNKDATTLARLKALVD
jgi:pyrroloquinoline quinone (PQQ) biosynthesis protein C